MDQGYQALCKDVTGHAESVLGPKLDGFLGVFLATALAFKNPGEDEYHAYARFLLPYLRELDAKPPAERSPEEQMAYERLSGALFSFLGFEQSFNTGPAKEEIAKAQARIANAQREIAALNAEMAAWDAQHAQQDPGAPRLNLGTLYGGRPDNDDKIARQQEIVREQQAVIAQQEAVIAGLNRDELTTRVTEATQRFERDDLLARLETAGVPAGPINTVAQAFADPQVIHRSIALDIPREGAGSVPGVRTPIRFSDADLVLDRPAPALPREKRD